MSNTPSVGISIRLAPEVLARLEALAARERRSRSQLISFAIEAYLEQHEAQETTEGTVTAETSGLISPRGREALAAVDAILKKPVESLLKERKK